MEKARDVLGQWRTSTRLMHLGPNAHALTFPVALGTILNVVAFVTDPGEWQAKDGKLTAPACKSEAIQAFSAFSPVVRAIMDLLPEQLDKWAVFDTYDHPVPSYISGRLCLAGDAAHASAPHHGAGAGCGIEDNLALAVLLEAAARSDVSKRPSSVRTALQVYNSVRYERSQFLVESSRIIGEVYEWRETDCGTDYKKIAHEIDSRSHKIWDYDVDAMVGEALDQFGRATQEQALITVSSKEISSTEKLFEGANPPEEMRFLSGFALAAVIVSFTVVYFLMMLDMSILATVRQKIAEA